MSVLGSAGSDAGAGSPGLGWCPRTRPSPALGRCSPLILRWDLRLVKVPGSTAGLIMRASFTSPGIRRFTAVSVREHRHLVCHPFFNGVLHVCIHNRIPLPKAHKGNNTTTKRELKALKQQRDVIYELELNSTDHRGNTLEVSTVVQQINATAQLMDHLQKTILLAKTQCSLKNPKLQTRIP